MIIPVTVKLAKLLKEKGFNKKVLNCYNIENNNISTAPHYELSNFNAGVHYSAPTIAGVLMWLYEKHRVWISVDMVFEETQMGFWYCIRESKMDDFAIQSEEYETSAEAYDAAITYTLNNII